MTDITVPSQPSPASLLKALAIAFVIAAGVLVLVVLPAERNIDITGFGQAIGLTSLSEPSAESAEMPPANPSSALGMKFDEQTVIEIPPGKGLEYKFNILAEQKLKFAWSTDTGELFYDFHGEPKGAPGDFFESFAAGTASGAKGTLTTPFEGSHGWYWKNRGSKPVKVTLVTSGSYDVIGLK